MWFASDGANSAAAVLIENLCKIVLLINMIINVFVKL